MNSKLKKRGRHRSVNNIMFNITLSAVGNVQKCYIWCQTFLLRLIYVFRSVGQRLLILKEQMHLNDNNV